MTDSKQFATFFIGGLYLGVEVLSVQEVIRFQEMTRVPLAPTMVHGLINLRGQIVPALDLRARFELPPRAPGQLPMNVVLRTSDGPVSLLADEIGDVVDAPDDCFESTPETLSGQTRELISGVYKLSGRLLLILDTERAVSLPSGYSPASPVAQ